MIGIVSVSEDLHALAVMHALQDRGESVALCECDRLSSGNGMSLHIDGDGQVRGARLRTIAGQDLDVRDLDVLWWRRVRADQLQQTADRSEHEAKLINNDCRGGLEGLLRSGFAGTWVSHPEATDRASNKVYQLRAAAAAGFRIPETLATQSRTDVIRFWERLEGRVIVKPVVGAAGPLLFTQYVGDPRELPIESFQIAPALYQEYIPGARHIRLNCFGDESYAALIESDALDWRPNLNVPMREWRVPAEVHERVRDVLDRLGLAMGIVDMKLTPDDEVVWLEVNPQGQFLFVEGMTGMPLTAHFAAYLASLPGRSS